jgi:hypothetical protein
LKSRQKKAIFVLLAVSFGFFFGLTFFIEVDSNTSNLVSEKENSIQPENSYTYSTQIIRPDDDLTNSGFTLVPGGGHLNTKINDNVSSPAAGGDIEYIIGDHDLDDCEVEMSSITLNTGQVVTGIEIYARGQVGGGLGEVTIRTGFRWRIGTGTYSSSNSVQFDESSFYWLSASPWTDLELSQSELNDLRIEISITGIVGVKTQEISVMYVELTIRSNENPSVNLTSPNGGEILQETANITWNYSDHEGDTITFNLLYDIAGAGWTPIVSGLVNETSYEWDLTGFTQRYDQVSVKIEADDGNGGYSEDISDDYFDIFVNHDPVVNLISPNGGEILQGNTSITWNFFDADDDLLSFNISYNIAGTGWTLIVSGLVNKSSYQWDLSSFTQRYDQVLIKLEVNDGYNGYSEDISGDYFVINVIDHKGEFDPIILILIVGASVGISGIFIGNNIVKRKRKKSIKNRDSPIPYKVKQVDSVGSNHKKIIVEADLLIRRTNNCNSKDLISNLFSKDSNLLNEVIGKEGYEVIKVLGKFHITTLSDDFWDKVEQFEWENNEKEEFIKDMLGLPPDCREQFIDDMLRQSKRR